MSSIATARTRCHARLACALWMLIGAAACGDDDAGPYEFVGSSCRDDFDCAPGIDCETGGDFPDGTCTVSCRDHFDCPRGAACVDVHGGVCLVACGSDTFCRREYRCRLRHNEGENGESRVCIK